jgi:hypothetical protein
VEVVSPAAVEAAVEAAPGKGQFSAQKHNDSIHIEEKRKNGAKNHKKRFYEVDTFTVCVGFIFGMFQEREGVPHLDFDQCMQ